MKVGEDHRSMQDQMMALLCMPSDPPRSNKKSKDSS